MSPLLRYMDAWQRHDQDAVLAAVADRCTVTECYGPVYRGRDRIEQWVRTWIERGGVVHAWDVDTHWSVGDQELAEWRFDHTWQGRRSTLSGCSVATSRDGLLHRLREYATSEPLYEWQGEWR